MESGRLYFDQSACNGNMLFLGNRNSFSRGTGSMMNMEESSKRRPFFSSHEDLFDEEYYDEQLPEKKRRLTLDQVHQLEKSFEAENKLEPEKKTQLAKKLGLQTRQVAVWFQNRRARCKTKQLERDYDHLKSNFDSLQSDYDFIVKENEKLKSELTSLSGKLQAEEVIATPISGQISESHPAENAAHVSILLQFNTKAEDGLSFGSASTFVVDEDAPQLMDSGDSFFPNYDYPEFMVPVEGIQSEDDGSDDGRSYFSHVYVAAEQQNQEEEEPMGWWVWS